MGDRAQETAIMIVQARMGSTRLPGKILKNILNKPLLAYQLERLKRVSSVKNLVVATTTLPEDQQVADLCQIMGIPVIRGDVENVLSRYLQAARAFNAQIIVRISGDCPLIDPALIDKAMQMFREHIPPYDYVSNTIMRTYPRGLDVEVFTIKSLEDAAKNARHLEEKEHVTPYIWQKPDTYHIGHLMQEKDESSYRWTVDTIEDFTLISKIIEALYPENPSFSKDNVIDLLGKHPDWIEINRHIQQKVLENRGRL